MSLHIFLRGNWLEPGPHPKRRAGSVNPTLSLLRIERIGKLFNQGVPEGELRTDVNRKQDTSSATDGRTLGGRSAYLAVWRNFLKVQKNYRYDPCLARGLSQWRRIHGPGWQKVELWGRAKGNLRAEN
jgi:hypothetical protein